MGEEEKQEMRAEQTTLSERFSGFAAYHFGASALISCVILGGLTLLLPILDVVVGSRAVSLFTALCMMLLYLPLGMAAAKNREWTVPQTEKEKILAVVQPTAVAWLWVGVVLLTLTLDGDAALSMLFIVFLLSILFAAPSSLFVLASIEWWGYGTRLQGIPALAMIGAVAGSLPPLFFALGSFWQSVRMEKKGLLTSGAGGTALPL